MTNLSDDTRPTPSPPTPPPSRMICDDIKPHKSLKNAWRVWAKALGPKEGCTDSEANKVAIIRTAFVVLTLITECCIIYNILLK